MTTQVIRTLTDSQRLELAHKLTTFMDAKVESFLADVHVHPMQVEPLLNELEARQWIVRDRMRGRISPGPAIPKAPDVAGIDQRRRDMLMASEVGRKVLALNTKTPGPKPGLSAERRAALLTGSSHGRAMLAAEAKAAEAKKA